MTMEIHNEIQSITPTDQYKPIELNEYVFVQRLKPENNKRVYNSPFCFKRMREKKKEQKSKMMFKV